MVKQKTQKEIKAIMKKHLCFGSFSYCCKSRCESKEACMKELGFKAEDFTRMKKEFDVGFFKFMKGGKK